MMEPKVTQMLVDRYDPAFEKPTKYIGQFYTEEKSRVLESKRGWQMKKDGERGWRPRSSVAPLLAGGLHRDARLARRSDRSIPASARHSGGGLGSHRASHPASRGGEFDACASDREDPRSTDASSVGGTASDLTVAGRGTGQ